MSLYQSLHCFKSAAPTHALAEVTVIFNLRCTVLDSNHFKDTTPTVGDPENAHHSSIFSDPAHHRNAKEAGTEVLLGDLDSCY